MKLPIAIIEYCVPDVPTEPMLSGKSWLISGCSTHYDLRSYAFLAQNTGQNLSFDIFSDLKPPQDGPFELELGVCLPDLFPNLDGVPEYCLDVAVKDKGVIPICLSNVMARLHFEKKDKQLHALIPRRALHKVREGLIEFIPPNAAVELLRSFATCRFRIAGSTAREALEEQLYERMHEFIEYLNVLVRIVPFVDEALGRVYSVSYSRATFERMYIVIKGDQESDIGHGWVAPHVGRTSFNPPDLSKEKTMEFLSLAAGTTEPDDIKAILFAAKSFLDGGVMDYVLLLVVIAAETATQRYVTKRLKQEGVSNTKINDIKKNMTYSLMLNSMIYALTPINNKPNDNIIGMMNKARTMRNNYVHNGVKPETDEVNTVFTYTEQYIKYICSLDAKMASASPVADTGS